MVYRGIVYTSLGSRTNLWLSKAIYPYRLLAQLEAIIRLARHSYDMPSSWKSCVFFVDLLIFCAMFRNAFECYAVISGHIDIYSSSICMNALYVELLDLC